MGDVINLGSMPLASLLNRSVARLGNLGLISVDITCNKDVHISALVSWFFSQILCMPLSVCSFDDIRQ